MASLVAVVHQWRHQVRILSDQIRPFFLRLSFFLGSFWYRFWCGQIMFLLCTGIAHTQHFSTVNCHLSHSPRQFLRFQITWVGVCRGTPRTKKKKLQPHVLVCTGLGCNSKVTDNCRFVIGARRHQDSGWFEWPGMRIVRALAQLFPGEGEKTPNRHGWNLSCCRPSTSYPENYWASAAAIFNCCTHLSGMDNSPVTQRAHFRFLCCI